MCGICCIFQANTSELVLNEEYITKNSRLENRGPDSSSYCTVDLSDGTQIMFSGYVLHLRGDDLVTQPASHSNGDILLWNAEVFGGMKVEENECDTQVILDILAGCSDEESVLSTLGKIQGPWSFLYWQKSSESLWFGRDVFGRRSLLWHLPDSDSDVLALSSVQLLPWEFQEVPSVGIYRLTHNTEASGFNLTLFPWKQAVWPGTLESVTKDSLNRLYSDRPVHGVKFELREDLAVDSPMPRLNKTIPSRDIALPQISDKTHLEYLKDLLKENEYLKALSDQLISVLQLAVKTRVENQRRLTCCCGTDRYSTQTSRHVMKHKLNSADNELAVRQDGACFDSCDRIQDKSSETVISGRSRPQAQESASVISQRSSSSARESDSEPGASSSDDVHMTSCARVAILFSGGIDSAVIAVLADRVVPPDESIDLINVAFEQRPKNLATGQKHRPRDVSNFDKWAVPDRQTGYIALGELNPDRRWNFIEVNVTAEELQNTRSEHIQYLVYPLNTVLDDSIGCAVWFAARGQGVMGNGPDKGKPVVSTSRVILCGMGADEQLIGYSRHRGRFQEEGWEGLLNEIELEITRISSRNLGRDDRIITDHGKESRFPFLDERVVQFLSGLPINEKADLTLSRGLGEKLLLRLAAVQLGLSETATQPKRAIQFGSRIAKMENSKEKASDTCSRLK